MMVRKISPPTNGPRAARTGITFRILDTMLAAAARRVANRRGRSAWLLKHPAKIIPIVGSMTNPERIRDAAKAARRGAFARGMSTHSFSSPRAAANRCLDFPGYQLTISIIVDSKI